MADPNNPTLQIVIELLKKGDTTGAIQELKNLQQTSGDTSASLDKLMGIAKNAFAAIASVEFLKSAIESAVTYNKTIAALNGTLKATGQYSDDYAAELKAQRSELEETTMATDEQVAAIQTMLVMFGATKEQLPVLTKLSLDLAAVLGTDGRSAALEFGKALQGQETALTRLGFHFDQNASYTENFASLVEQANKRVGGAASEMAKSSTTALDQLGKAWHEKVRMIGEDVSTILAPAFNLITKSLQATPTLDQLGGMEGVINVPDSLNAGKATSTGKVFGPAPGPGSSSFIGPVQQPPEAAAQIQATKQALDDLKQKFQDYTNIELEGSAKVRADAQVTFSQEMDYIDQRKRKGELTEDQVSQFREEAIDKWLAAQTHADDMDRQQKMQIAQTEAQLQASGLTGLQKMIAEETNRYALEKQKILENSQLEMAEKTKLLALNDQAHAQAVSNFDKYEPTDKLQLMEQQLTVSLQGQSETRLAAIDREFAVRMKAYQDLLADGQITEKKLADLATKAEATKMQALAPVAKEGETEIQRTNLSPGDFDTKQIEAQYDKRIDLVNAYYEFAKSKAKDNQEEQDYLEQEQTYTVEQMEEKKRFAITQTGQLIQKIGPQAAQQFSSGFANAFVEFVSGQKSAQQAFEEFAASFLTQIAEMIIQQEILNAIKNSSLGSFLGLAAGGQVIAAASGVAGVSSVSSPTFFPKFNVLAGEAGEEALTVLAKPQTVNWGGVVAQLGNVGANRLAIVNADTLQNLVQSRQAKMAAGGVGPTLPGASGSSSVGTGRLVIEVRVSDRAEADIVSNAVRGAVTQVTKDLGNQTPISSAVKKLTR